MTDIIETLFMGDEMPVPEFRDHNSHAGYRLNSKGYRCDEFDRRKDINVVSVGCSNTFGWGLKDEDRFSYVFVKLLSEHTRKTVQDWNIGEPAKSNDCIARQVLNAKRILKPDIMLICFTDVGRREYFGIEYNVKQQTGCFDWVPGEFPEGVKKHKPHFMPYAQRFYGLSSPFDDQVNLFKNLLLISRALDDTPWLFATFCEENPEVLKRFQKWHVGGFPVCDKASDGLHPGPESNRKLANKFFNRYKNVYLAKNSVAQL